MQQKADIIKRMILPRTKEKKSLIEGLQDLKNQLEQKKTEIRQIVRLGGIPCFIFLCSQSDSPKLQLLAASCLVHISQGTDQDVFSLCQTAVIRKILQFLKGRRQIYFLIEILKVVKNLIKRKQKGPEKYVMKQIACSIMALKDKRGELESIKQLLLKRKQILFLLCSFVDKLFVSYIAEFVRDTSLLIYMEDPLSLMYFDVMKYCLDFLVENKYFLRPQELYSMMKEYAKKVEQCQFKYRKYFEKHIFNKSLVILSSLILNSKGILIEDEDRCTFQRTIYKCLTNDSEKVRCEVQMFLFEFQDKRALLEYDQIYTQLCVLLNKFREKRILFDQNELFRIISIYKLYSDIQFENDWETFQEDNSFNIASIRNCLTFFLCNMTLETFLIEKALKIFLNQQKWINKMLSNVQIAFNYLAIQRKIIKNNIQYVQFACYDHLYDMLSIFVNYIYPVEKERMVSNLMSLRNSQSGTITSMADQSLKLFEQNELYFEK